MILYDFYNHLNVAIDSNVITLLNKVVKYCIFFLLVQPLSAGKACSHLTEWHCLIELKKCTRVTFSSSRVIRAAVKTLRQPFNIKIEWNVVNVLYLAFPSDGSTVCYKTNVSLGFVVLEMFLTSAKRQIWRQDATGRILCCGHSAHLGHCKISLKQLFLISAKRRICHL